MAPEETGWTKSMPKLSISEPRKYWLVIPFAYAFVSRYHWPRDFMVNAVTAWVPGVLLIMCQAGFSPLDAIGVYLFGYTVFMCLYEVGYMINDSYGLRHDATPRERVAIKFDSTFVAVFVIFRMIVFTVIAWFGGLLTAPLFWAAALALVSLLTLHNTLQKLELKFLTFLQLSLMRFALPIAFALMVVNHGDNLLMIFLIGLLLFSYPRFLTYLEAKGRLTVPERKKNTFLLFSHLIALPLLIVISVIESSGAPIIIWAWMTLVQVIYYLVNNIAVLSHLKLWLGLNKRQGSE